MIGVGTVITLAALAATTAAGAAWLRRRRREAELDANAKRAIDALEEEGAKAEEIARALRADGPDAAVEMLKRIKLHRAGGRIVTASTPRGEHFALAQRQGRSRARSLLEQGGQT